MGKEEHVGLFLDLFIKAAAGRKREAASFI